MFCFLLVALLVGACSQEQPTVTTTATTATSTPIVERSTFENCYLHDYNSEWVIITAHDEIVTFFAVNMTESSIPFLVAENQGGFQSVYLSNGGNMVAVVTESNRNWSLRVYSLITHEILFSEDGPNPMMLGDFTATEMHYFSSDAQMGEWLIVTFVQGTPGAPSILNGQEVAMRADETAARYCPNLR